MAAIEVSNLTKHYGNTKAVNGISFIVEKGEIFGFLGPNGAGKTSTIRMLVGLSLPTSGRAYVAGYDVIGNIRLVKQRIGVVPEQSKLYDELTVAENLSFVAKLYHVPPGKRKKKITELLRPFPINRIQRQGLC